jgi:16S rRNA (cytosine967-C5)-methyltransferase
LVKIDKVPTSRQFAVECLVEWDRRKQPIAPMVEAIIYRSALKPEDRHLAVNMVQGVLRRMQDLDATIGRFSKVPVRKMKPLTLMTLRVGVFQILFLDRIPDSAAVNETVKVMKGSRQPRWLVNFVNGVLRNIVRNKKELPDPDTDTGLDGSTLNHPDWLVQRWNDHFGPERTRAICRENNTEPHLALRVNTRLSSGEELAELFRREGYAVRPGRYAPDSLVLEDFSGPVSALPGYGDGLFHVQDEAAQLVTLLLGPFAEGARYLDGCAGLGGKTCQLAQLMPDRAELVAVEPDRYRVKLLRENLQRLHLDAVAVYHGRLDAFCAENSGLFAGVLVDAPCSGTGVVRRHPDIRWNRRQEDLHSYQLQQADLLEQAASLVEPGGILVYATCSMEPEENVDVVEAFLEKHSGFAAEDCKAFLPEAAAVAVTASGFFAPVPADGMDGFFGARLVRDSIK